jgi:intron-binding protein aquarius
MIDCQSSLNTRRFFHAVMDDAHILVKCRLSRLYSRKEGRVFAQLVEALEFYSSYEITLTGSDLSEQERTTDHYNRATALQRTIYSLFSDQELMKKFATAPIFKIDTRVALKEFFESLRCEFIIFRVVDE